MSEHLAEVRRLRDANGWGCRRIAAELGLGKDVTLRLLNKLKFEDARGSGGSQAIAQIEPQTVAEYAERISACWHRSREAFIEAGRLLCAAKASLDHGEFTLMVETQLPFKLRKAEMLMAIYRDRRLVNLHVHAILPNELGTLYEITRLDDASLSERLMDGTIRPDMERADLCDVPRRLGASRQMNRVEPADLRDPFFTPPWATRALCEVVLPKLVINPNHVPHASVWEPACGEGHISEVLSEYFGSVLATDIHDYGRGDAWPGKADFLDMAAPVRADWIITNPPFRGNMAERFVLRALDLAQVGVAMFVALQFLESVGRYERIFKDRPPTLISFFSERVPCLKGRWNPDASSDAAYIWLVWVKDRAPMAPFWIPPGQRVALTHPDDRARFAAWSIKQSAQAAE